MQQLLFRSLLHAPVDQVWAQISTMRGVNEELSPWLRMSVPARFGESRIEAVEPPGRSPFSSWLLLMGFLPFDLHRLHLHQVSPPLFFEERSRSWLQRSWHHDRRLEQIDETRTRLTDELRFEPRLSAAAPLTRRIVEALFRHRHRQLRKRFGGSSCTP